MLLLDLRYLNTMRRYSLYRNQIGADESYLPGSIENLSFRSTCVGCQTCSLYTDYTYRMVCAVHLRKKEFLSRYFFFWCCSFLK